MGDRTSVWIRIGGQVKDLDALVAALEAECMTPDWTGRGKEKLVDEMRAAAANPDGAEFHADEVNYGNCDDLEAECQRQDLSYEFHWHAGGGFGEGGHIWTPAEGFLEYEGEGGNTTTTASQIRGGKFATLDDLLAHLDGLDKFKPGPLLVPHPLVQAVIKARKEHADE
jgi:hypothetical protein